MAISRERRAAIADLYDNRVIDPKDLNTRLGKHERPVHHHAGIVRFNEKVPENEEDALDWLYDTEEKLCDFLWQTIQGLSLRPVHRVLDLGCGEGGTAARISKLAQPDNLDVVGLTLSEAQRKMAQVNCPRGRFLVQDMLTAEFEKPFDVALAIESTEYLSPDGLKLLAKQTMTWLARNGLLVIIAGSYAPVTNADDPLVAMFDQHYRTQLSSSDDYRAAAEAAGLIPAGELDLGPVTLPYWKARWLHQQLRNSTGALAEHVVVTALETGAGEYRLYAWYTPNRSNDMD